MELQSLKQRFNIIGDDPKLNLALDVAVQVAPTDLSVLITGESGVGKEVIPQIIHQYSPRKHNSYIAVNCGAIPEGTIDSELFGHEKGSFTGATSTREGYFEVANGGTIFLDEVADLPLSTQVRLLRVLQSGEFIKVGSSKVQKTNVRVVAATNVNIQNAIKTGKFREDLYYRLATIPISIPPLRDRKGDIYMLFRKFAVDFSDKNKIPVIRLTKEAQLKLISYPWPGNIRQLKSIAEQISILERERDITPEILEKYLPTETIATLPVLANGTDYNFINDSQMLYKMIVSLKQEIDSLKEGISSGKIITNIPSGVGVAQQVSVREMRDISDIKENEYIVAEPHDLSSHDEVFSIKSQNEDLIKKCLEKNRGNRRATALELGISERTLYRKIKQYKLDE